jgi:hypothetical protein
MPRWAAPRTTGSKARLPVHHERRAASSLLLVGLPPLLPARLIFAELLGRELLQRFLGRNRVLVQLRHRS